MLKHWIADIKGYVWIIGLIAAITGGVIAYANIPTRVENVETLASKTEDKVDKMAIHIQSYVEMQKVREEGTEQRYNDRVEWQNKQNDIMWKVMEKMSER